MTKEEMKLHSEYCKNKRNCDPITEDQKRAYALYHREYRKRNAEKARFYSRRWKIENNHKKKRDYKKERARAKVRYALKTGQLIKFACRDCGELETEAHHEDYNKPLDVIWVCKPCHAIIHRKYN